MMLTTTDIRFAVRLLLRSPWFTLTTLLVLTGGLAISLYTYSVLNTLVYGELPLPDGSRIVTIGSGEWPDFAPLDAWEVAQIRDQTTGIAELGAYRSGRAMLGGISSGRNVRSIESDWRIFEFARTAPALGRAFVPEDSIEGAEPVIVLSRRVWETDFSADEAVVGQTIRVNDRPARIVGVMPEGFHFPNNADVWQPLSQALLNPAGYTQTRLNTYARVAEGVSAGTAEAEATAVLRRLRSSRSFETLRSQDAVSVLSFQARSFGVFGDVVFGVLNLLACSILMLAAVNVGNLLLARINRRIREIGVRIALGAPRIRLIVQVVMENFLICAVSAVIAVALAQRALEATNTFMRNLLGDDLPFWWSWQLDADLVLFAVAALALTVTVVSVFPAISVSRTDPNAVLREGSRGGGVNMGRVSRALVTLQVALITAFMVVGGTATIIAQRVADFDLGFDIENMLTTNVALPQERYATPEARFEFRRRLLDELRASPEADAAMVMQQTEVMRFAPSGEQLPGVDDYPGAWRVILSDMPVPMGPELVAGRWFDQRDEGGTLETVLVSESLARTHWPDGSALGRTIAVVADGTPTQQRTIVGIVRDVSWDPVGMAPVGLDAIYVPLSQSSSAALSFIVRHRGSAARASAAIYETLSRLDPAVSPGRVMSYRDALDQITLFGRTITRLFAGCALFTVVLAITGIFGMSSNGVILRSHEIGLRRALGASNGRIIAMFFAQGSRQLIIGLVLSALLSIAALAVASQGFALDGRSLSLLGLTVTAAVSMTVLVSIYLSVRGVLSREPSAVLRQA